MMKGSLSVAGKRSVHSFRPSFLKFSLLALIFLLNACATVKTHTDIYALDENWIDVDDVTAALAAPDIHRWVQLTGQPVIVEAAQDTARYIFNYKSKLYRTKENGVQFKPNEKDAAGLWSSRHEIVSLVVVEGQLVAVENNTTYTRVFSNEAQAIETTEKKSPPKALVVVGLGAFLVLFILLIANN